MKSFQLFAGFVALFVQEPVWLFLMYTILAAIHPDRLVWFLFWVYVPSDFVIALGRASAQTATERRAIDEARARRA